MKAFARAFLAHFFIISIFMTGSQFRKVVEDNKQGEVMLRYLEQRPLSLEGMQNVYIIEEAMQENRIALVILAAVSILAGVGAVRRFMGIASEKEHLWILGVLMVYFLSGTAYFTEPVYMIFFFVAVALTFLTYERYYPPLRKLRPRR